MNIISIVFIGFSPNPIFNIYILKIKAYINGFAINQCNMKNAYKRLNSKISYPHIRILAHLHNLLLTIS